MNAPGPTESPNTAKIQAALDELVAERRKANTRPPSASPLLDGRRPLGSYLFFGLLALGLHAAGLYWFMLRAPDAADPVLVVDPAPRSGESWAIVPPSPAPASAPRPNDPVPPAGIIRHNGKVIVVPASTPGSHPPTPRRAMVAAPAPASRVISPSTPPAPAAPPGPSLSDHAQAAQDFAHHHFRYKYKVGSANYAVTSLNVVIHDTEEVPSWNRHRSTGEAGLEYYDNSGFRRTTRRFEVLTEAKNGKAVGFDITVK